MYLSVAFSWAPGLDKYHSCCVVCFFFLTYILLNWSVRYLFQPKWVCFSVTTTSNGRAVVLETLPCFELCAGRGQFCWSRIRKNVLLSSLLASLIVPYCLKKFLVLPSVLVVYKWGYFSGHEDAVLLLRSDYPASSVQITPPNKAENMC